MDLDKDFIWSDVIEVDFAHLELAIELRHYQCGCFSCHGDGLAVYSFDSHLQVILLDVP